MFNSLIKNKAKNMHFNINNFSKNDYKKLVRRMNFNVKNFIKMIIKINETHEKQEKIKKGKREKMRKRENRTALERERELHY